MYTLCAITLMLQETVRCWFCKEIRGIPRCHQNSVASFSVDSDLQGFTVCVSLNGACDGDSLPWMDDGGCLQRYGGVL